MNNKQLARKNKILAAILAVIALFSAAGAFIWLYIYAPLVLK